MDELTEYGKITTQQWTYKPTQPNNIDIKGLVSTDPLIFNNRRIGRYANATCTLIRGNKNIPIKLFYNDNIDVIIVGKSEALDVIKELYNLFEWDFPQEYTLKLVQTTFAVERAINVKEVGKWRVRQFKARTLFTIGGPISEESANELVNVLKE